MENKAQFPSYEDHHKYSSIVHVGYNIGENILSLMFVSVCQPSSQPSVLVSLEDRVH